jgi:hypothetical protein
MEEFNFLRNLKTHGTQQGDVAGTEQPGNRQTLATKVVAEAAAAADVEAQLSNPIRNPAGLVPLTGERHFASQSIFLSYFD